MLQISSLFTCFSLEARCQDVLGLCCKLVASFSLETRERCQLGALGKGAESDIRCSVVAATLL